jgi:hypothetical protein
MPEYIRQNELAKFIENTIAQTYKGLQAAARDRGLPTYAIEQFELDAIVLTDEGFAALRAEAQTTTVAPQITTQQNPEVKQTSKTNRTSTGKTDGKTDGRTVGTDKADDTSSESSKDLSNESVTDAGTQSDTSTSEDKKQYGNEVRVTTEVKS